MMTTRSRQSPRIENKRRFVKINNNNKKKTPARLGEWYDGIFTSNKKQKVNNTDIRHLFDTESGFTPTIESFKVCIMYVNKLWTKCILYIGRLKSSRNIKTKWGYHRKSVIHSSGYVKVLKPRAYLKSIKKIEKRSTLIIHFVLVELTTAQYSANFWKSIITAH